jgi:hypothetical protein
MNNRRLRCATPPVIHNAAASAAILLNQNKNSTEILRFWHFLTNNIFSGSQLNFWFLLGNCFEWLKL